jgi:hypothetical protein
MFPFDGDCSLLLYEYSTVLSRCSLRCTSRAWLHWGNKKTCVILWAVQMCLRDMGLEPFELPHIQVQLRGLQSSNGMRIGFLADLARALLGGSSYIPISFAASRGYGRATDFGKPIVHDRDGSGVLYRIPRWKWGTVSYTAGILWNDSWPFDEEQASARNPYA